VDLPVARRTNDYYAAIARRRPLWRQSVLSPTRPPDKRSWHYQLVHHGLWATTRGCAELIATHARRKFHHASRSHTGLRLVFNR